MATRWRIQNGTATIDALLLRADNGEETLQWALYRLSDGVRVMTGSDWCTTPTAAQLVEWNADAPGLAARCQQRELGACYVRYGRLPRAVQSRNYATGQNEAGVSCYEAQYNPMTDRYELSGSGLIGAAIYHMAAKTASYLIRGEHIGYGSDSEPLVRDPVIISRLIETCDGFEVRK